MNVRLISVTKPASDGYGPLTGEQLIVYCARVSNPFSQEAGENIDRLIKYLVRHRHWSPFEMADMTVEIECSIAISRQLIRHHSFSFQEFSQRYANPTNLGYEIVAPRAQGSSNRQGGDALIVGEDVTWWQEAQRIVYEKAFMYYDAAVAKGISREQARYLLPMQTNTLLFMKGSIRSWIHYLQARLSPDTQQEHREIAEAISNVFAIQFPHVHKAVFEGNDE